MERKSRELAEWKPGTKTARFASVLAASGQPEIVYLWTEPQANREFMRAVREKRVMTLTQQNVGTQKDYGLVGFFEDQNAAYLVFPKPVTEFEGKRVIGIDYTKLAVPGPVGPVVKPAAEPRRRQARRLFEASQPRRHTAPQQQAHPQRRFRVTFRFTASEEAVQEVEAASRNAAVEEAGRRVRVPDLLHGSITRKVVKTEPI